MIESYRHVSPSVHPSAFVHATSVVVGDVTLSQDVSIWPLVAARGDVNYISIGQRTNIQDGSVLHVSRPTQSNKDGYPLVIGNDVTVGHKCMLHGCTLGNRILVGMGAIIMDGVVVQNDVFIGAGTLVTPGKILESGFLYVGNPAIKKRPLTTSEIDFLVVSSANYVLLKNEYISQMP